MKKRILAVVLALALMVSLFAGQTSYANAYGGNGCGGNGGFDGWWWWPQPKVTQYALNYYLNGDNGWGTVINPVMVNENEDATVEGELYADNADGRIFKGWAVSIEAAEALEVTYNAGDKITMTEDVNLYGVYTQGVVIEYMNDYDMANNCFRPISIGEAEFDSTFELQALRDQNDRMFVGFSMDGVEGLLTEVKVPTMEEFYAESQANVITLTANWANTYNIVYRDGFSNDRRYNCGEVSKKGPYENDYALLSVADLGWNHFGYVFKGWENEWTHEVLAAGDKINLKNGCLPCNNTISYKALWERGIVICLKNGNGCESKHYTVAKNTEVTIPENPFEKDGYVFAGWTYKQKDWWGNVIKTETYADQDKVTLNDCMANCWENCIPYFELEANWVEAYSIHFNGGTVEEGDTVTGSMADIKAGYGLTITVPECGFTATAANTDYAYKFTGWEVSKGTLENGKFTLDKTQKIEERMYSGNKGFGYGYPCYPVWPVWPWNPQPEDNDKDVTFTATWQKVEKTYTVTFYDGTVKENGEKNEVGQATIGMANDNEMTFLLAQYEAGLEEITSEGLVFAGWGYTDENGNTTVYTQDQLITLINAAEGQNIELVAQWTKPEANGNGGGVIYYPPTVVDTTTIEDEDTPLEETPEEDFDEEDEDASLEDIEDGDVALSENPLTGDEAPVAAAAVLALIALLGFAVVTKKNR